MKSGKKLIGKSPISFFLAYRYFLSYYPARNTLLFHPNPQMFASAKLPNNNLLHVVARKIRSQNRS